MAIQRIAEEVQFVEKRNHLNIRGEHWVFEKLIHCERNREPKFDIMRSSFWGGAFVLISLNEDTISSILEALVSTNTKKDKISWIDVKSDP